MLGAVYTHSLKELTVDHFLTDIHRIGARKYCYPYFTDREQRLKYLVQDDPGILQQRWDLNPDLPSLHSVL